jgi:uncharacterized protein YeaO (DUF488 family)
MAAYPILIKRIYERPGADDGARVLIDRLWPRGMAKADAAIDCWLKEAAPSADLRRWFAHDPARWQEFRLRYLAQLQARPEVLRELAAMAQSQPVTLLTASRDEAHNHALVLREAVLACRKEEGAPQRP